MRFHAASAALALALAGPALAAAPPWHPERGPHARRDRVVLTLEAPAESEVFVVGDFNHWDPTATPLQHTGGGVWEVLLDLQPGEYRYRFLVDGASRLDPSNPDEVAESDGGYSSRLRVLGNGRVSGDSWKGDPRRATDWTYRPSRHRDFGLGADLSFNRVDGTTLWLEPSYAPREDFVPEFEGRFGYGWESERVNVDADFAQPLLRDRTILFGLHFADGTGFQNPSEIGIGENTLAGLFLGHDFIDYYDIQGIEPSVRFRLPGQLGMRLAYGNENYKSVGKGTDWSFFKAGNDVFRDNPSLYLLPDPAGTGGEGRLQAVRFELVKDTRRARQIGTIGTYARGFVEIGRGDFDYNRIVLDGRRYMRLGRLVHLALRAQGGSRFGHDAMPSQKLFYLGGLGTVRGHSFFAQSGDRELLGNVEYTFVIDRLQHGLMVFYDAGTAWNSLERELSSSVVLQSLGFAFKSLDDDFLVDFAWPVGSVGGEMQVSVRLNRTF